MFYLQHYGSPLHKKKKSSIKQTEYVFKYPCNAVVCFLFLRPVRLHGKLLKILMPARNTLLRKHERLAFHRWRWRLFVINTVYRIICMKIFFIIYYEVHKWKSLIFLNRLLREVLGHTPTIILTILFCKVNIFPLLDELPQNIMPCFVTVKICEINWFESVMLLISNIDLTVYQAPIYLGITCSIWFFQFRWLSICKSKKFCVYCLFYVLSLITNA